MTILMTEMEYAIKMTLLNTQQSLVEFLEQLGAETNDLNAIFKKAIIKTVLSFVLFSVLFIILIIIIFSIFFFFLSEFRKKVYFSYWSNRRVRWSHEYQSQLGLLSVPRGGWDSGLTEWCLFHFWKNFSGRSAWWSQSHMVSWANLYHCGCIC